VDEKKQGESCCDPGDTICCKVEALVSIDDRGQMVLPKELRKKANINAGDKLVISSWEKDGELCCMFLTKAEELNDMVKTSLKPFMNSITK
jgi:AbrB family looped-hinge helix DNA binding protein